MTELVLNPLPVPAATEAQAPPEPTNPLLDLVKKALQSGADIATLTKIYLAVLDKKKDLETAAKNKTAPLSEGLSLIENHLLAKFDELGVDNMKTQFGTPYTSTTTTISVADADVFQRFVLAEAFAGIALKPEIRDAIITHILNSGALALMETRAAKAAVETFAESTKQMPPGLNVRSERKLNVKSK